MVEDVLEIVEDFVKKWLILNYALMLRIGASKWTAEPPQVPQFANANQICSDLLILSEALYDYEAWRFKKIDQKVFKRYVRKKQMAYDTEAFVSKKPNTADFSGLGNNVNAGRKNCEKNIICSTLGHSFAVTTE